MIRSLRSVILLALLLTAGFALPQTRNTLVLLHTNDMHGQVLPRDGVGGLAALATLIRREKPDLLIDGGDMFTGTMVSDEFFGKPMIEIMNRLGYAAVALGNHEFDYGLPELRSRLKEAHFPVLSANVTGIPEVRPYTVLTVEGIRIGVIGVTVENLAEVTHPRNLKTISVRNVVDAVRETLPKARPLSDFVILVGHISEEEQIRLARAFPEIRLIVTGHTHVAHSMHIGQTLIVEAGSSTQLLGRVTIELSGKTPDLMISEVIPVRNVTPDPEIDSIITSYQKSLATRAAERLGEATTELRKSDIEESPLNNLIADALRDAARTQIAFYNVGGIRAILRRGPITRGSIFEILPFQDTLVTMNLTGAQLKQVLGRRVLAVSGLRVVWDTRRPSQNRLVSVTLAGGQPIQDTTRYTVVVNEFLAAGGDGFVELANGTSVLDTGILPRDALTSYVKNHPRVSDVTDGRVTIRN
jgi:5'-nucleotidase/UDP-sugar diphosphatase